MAKDSDNTVSSANQLSLEESIFSEKNNGVKILFLGNSITRHGAAPGIGWYGTWGMAASEEDKDYVHRTMSKVRTIDPDASFMVAQVSIWEREYWSDTLIEDNFAPAMKFMADIIVVRAIENVRELSHDGVTLQQGYEALIKKMSGNPCAKVIVTTSFWPVAEKDAVLTKLASDNGYKLVDVGIGADDRYTAKGIFEHAGVAAHPGDAGMEEMAVRIFEGIKEYL